MKKLLALIIALAMLSLLLVACSDTTGTTDSTEKGAGDNTSTTTDTENGGDGTDSTTDRENNNDSQDSTTDSENDGDGSDSTTDSTQNGGADTDDEPEGKVVISSVIYRPGDGGEEYYVEGLEQGFDSDIVIPEEINGKPVTKILYRAFYGIEGLSSISIPKTVTEIEELAGIGMCPDLTSINVAEENTVYKSIDGNLYDANEETLLVYAIGKKDESFTVPQTVRTVWHRAFEGCTSLKSVDLGTVNMIGGNAFSGCTALADLEIPDSVRAIDGYAFFGCSSIESVTIPARTMEIGVGAFANCASLKEINVAEGNIFYLSNDGILYTRMENPTLLQYPAGKDATSFVVGDQPHYFVDIAQEAFYGANKLESFIVEDGVLIHQIANIAFRDCKNLKTVILSDMVERIGQNAFYGCDNVTIYCQDTEIDVEAKEMNRYWSNWNMENHPVVYGYEYEN